MGRHRRLIVVLAIALLVVVAFFGYRAIYAAMHKQTVQYITAPVQRQTLVASVSGTGNVAVGDAVAVDPSISGTVAELQVNVGSKVKAGDLLFRVVNTQLDASVSQSLGSYQQAQSSAAQARISYQQAEETLEQMEETYEQQQHDPPTNPPTTSTPPTTAAQAGGGGGAGSGGGSQGGTSAATSGGSTTGAATATVTEDDIELQKEKVYQADLAVQAADTSVKTAKLNYDQSKVDAAKRTVSAPIDGVVTLLNVSNGQTLGSASVRSSSSGGGASGGASDGGASSSSSSSSSGQAPVVISNLSSAQALVQLNETDISSVKLGQRSNLSFDAISGLTLTGKVTLIDIQGTVSSGVVTYSVTITPDIQDPRLKPGMTVTADIITAAHTDVLTVPNAAVKTARDGSNYVDVLSNGQPVQKTVEIGLANDTDTEVASGLTANDTVITQTIQPNTTSTTARSGIGLGGGGGGPPGGGAGGIIGGGR